MKMRSKDKNKHSKSKTKIDGIGEIMYQESGNKEGKKIS